MNNPLKENSKTILAVIIITGVTLSMLLAGAASSVSISHNYQYVYAAAKNSNSSSSSSPSIGSKTFLTVTTKVSGGTSKPSDFTISVSGNSPSPKSFSGSSSGTSVTLNAGKYKVTASGPTGYTSSYSSGCSGTASGGTPVKCTVSNKYTATAPTPAPGSITSLNVITNVMNGTKKPSDFTISVSGNSPSPKSFSGSSSGTSVTLNAGKYKVTASGPTGYTSSYSSGCSGTASGGTPVKCTVSNKYTSAATPPELTNLLVTLNVNNTKGGAAKLSDFPIFVSGKVYPGGGSVEFSGAITPKTVTLISPSYLVVIPEQPPNYAINYSPGCEADISGGETMKCTISAIYSPPRPPTTSFIVILHIVNTKSPKPAKPSDFLLRISGNNPIPGSPFSLPPSAEQKVEVGEGRFQVHVSNSPANYGFSYYKCEGFASGSGSLPPCEITTYYYPPSFWLKVFTNVNNTKGGTKQPKDFSIFVSGDNVSPKPPAPGSDRGGPAWSMYGTGSKYTVTASEQPGYSIEYSPECSGIASGSEHSTLQTALNCKITAFFEGNPLPSYLKVFTNVDNTKGGTKQPSDFSISVTGNRVTNCRIASPCPGSPFGTELVVYDGQYNVSSSGQPGYSIEYSPECSGIAKGPVPISNAIKCTISAFGRPLPARLIVTTNVDNTKGGTKQPSDFTVGILRNDPQTGQQMESFYPGSKEGQEMLIGAGRFDVQVKSINGPGYEIGYSSYNACHGIAYPSDTLKCTILATFQQNPMPFGSVTVTFNLDNSGGGTQMKDAFTIYLNGTLYPSGSGLEFSGKNPGIGAPLRSPGEFNVRVKSGPIGYTTKYSSGCSSPTVISRNIYECTITAKYSGPPPPPPPAPGKIHFIIVDKANCGHVGQPSECPALGHTLIYVAPRPGDPYPIAHFVANSNHEYVEVPGKYMGEPIVVSTGPTQLTVGSFKYDKFIFRIPAYTINQCGSTVGDSTTCYIGGNMWLPPDAGVPFKHMDIEIDTYWSNYIGTNTTR